MDKLYSFNWLIGAIDESIIFMLRDGEKVLGSYSVTKLVTNGLEDANIQFANIQDLTIFLEQTHVRFTDSRNSTNIIEIPLNKLYLLYERASMMNEGVPSSASLHELEAFAVYGDHVIRDGYAIYAYKIHEESDDLKRIMEIARAFKSENWDKQFDFLGEVNNINYQNKPKENKTI